MAGCVKPTFECAQANNEVFSPAIRTSSKGAVGAAGQGQRPVVGDFDHGSSVRVPPRGTWHLRWHMRLTCSDALSGGPCTADPGEKTSMHSIDGVLCPLIACQASHPETR